MLQRKLQINNELDGSIFLFGARQTGKSTLIRKTLGNHIRQCGGFASQRLMDESGKILGFRIGPAATTPINARVAFGSSPGEAAGLSERPNDASGSVPTASSPSCPLVYPDGTMPDNVFRYWDQDGTGQVDTEVFISAGLEYLRPRPENRFMLLDEIGGVELACGPFMDALTELIRSDLPCVGVLKLRSNVERIGDPAVLSAYDKLRNIISTEPDSHILYHRGRL